MALFSELRSKPAKSTLQRETLMRQAWLVPEALTLVLLLLLAVALDFPPVLGFTALLTMLWFLLRLGLMALARCELDTGAYAQAARRVQLALRLNPWSADALMLAAQVASQQGADESAEAMLRRALSLYPNDRELQSVLATTVLAQGRITEGWQLAHTDDHGRCSPHTAQQRAWYALHVEGDAAKARAIVLRAAPERLILPLALPLQVTLAEACVALGAHVEARAVLDAVQARLDAVSRPQQAELLYHLGRITTVLGDNGAHLFRRSVEIDPAGRHAQAAWRGAVDSR